jgi:outer membrane protein, multidrug efflux system
MPLRNPAFAWASFALLLAGCAVGPNYHKPTPGSPAHFGELGRSGESGGPDPFSEEEASPSDLARWWTVFHDPELDSLVERALRNNRDLKVAVSRVREARAERQVAAGALIPEIDATAGFNRSLGSKNVVLPLSALGGGGALPASGKASSTTSPDPSSAIRPQVAANSPADTVVPPSAPPSASAAPPGGPASPFGEGGLPGVTTNLFQAGFDAVWEIDVFGGVRRSVEAADAEAAASQEGEYGVRVTLLAEVATTYIQLRSDQQREAIARENIESQRKTWRISQDKFNAGIGDEVEPAQELTQLRLSEAALPPLVAAERVSEHALGFLLGEDPTALSAELEQANPLPQMPDRIPVGVPSDLLLRRPDIRQAERQLAAASAQVGVATAQLYPQFSLTGSLGIDSSDLKHLPEWSSRYYSIAPGVSWPILDWAKLHAAIRVSNEGQAQALLAYQTAVSQALKDVEDALVQSDQEQGRHARLIEAAAQARLARDVTAQIYAHGLADQTATLQAERAVYQAEDALAQGEASLRVNLVGLYKALGGGWEVGDGPQ